MVGLNKIMVIGNVGTDPEMRYTANGNPVTSFRLATSRSYTTGSGERRQETEWFTIVCWNQLAEQCNQYLSKGRRASVEGRLASHTWEGQDGQTRARNAVHCNRVLLRDPPGPEGEADAVGDPGSGEPPTEPEDLPF